MLNFIDNFVFIWGREDLMKKWGEFGTFVRYISDV